MSFHLYSFRDNSTPCEWELHVIAACGKEGNWHAHERYLGTYVMEGWLPTKYVQYIRSQAQTGGSSSVSLVLASCQPLVGLY